MKATHTKTPPTFTPVTINITCETQEELDALTCLFNDSYVLCSIAAFQGKNRREANTDSLWAACDAAGGKVTRDSDMRDILHKNFQ